MRLPCTETPFNKHSDQAVERTDFSNHVYRFALSRNANSEERKKFRHGIQVLQQVNPGWAVTKDFPRLGEEEAFVLIYKDENYTSRYLAYIVTSSLSRAIEGAYAN